MAIPETDTAAYFEPQEASYFYAAQGAFFLTDPSRILDIAGDATLGSDLIKTLTRKSYPHDLYRQGAIVPALGVEQGHYTVHVRSTQTEGAQLPLSHILFSTGFVLGTETGDLLLCNTDRLQHWSPGQLPPTAKSTHSRTMSARSTSPPAGTRSPSSPASSNPTVAKKSGSPPSSSNPPPPNPPLPPT